MRTESARHVQSAFDREGFLRDGLPQVAFAGRSNVGKSSLLNKLLGRRSLAHTSSTPGRTRAINYFLVNSRFYFVDLPGFGYAKVAKQERQRWGRLMEQFFQAAMGRTQVIQLVDAKVGATPLDVQAHAFFTSLGYAPLLVATRADRVPRGRRARALQSIRETLDGVGEAIVAASARTGEGIREIWRAIDDFLASV